MPSPPPQSHGNLPHPLTRLVGRSEELSRLSQAAAKSRLLCLVGPAGVGKTRLAIEFAAARADRHAGGVWFVDLSTVTSPELAPELVAEVLGADVRAHRSTIAALTAFLGVRDTLLVLDNCEHLQQAAEGLAHALLAACPRLHVIATSRENLRVAGGLRWAVEALNVPDQASTRPRAIGRSPAVELFVAQAALSQPGFEINLDNARTIGDICRRLDGIPLALELCASRVRMMPVDEILERLGNRFDLLTDGSRVAAPRQRTLRATLDWSYELLDDAERALFRRVGVFMGSFDLPAADEVGLGGPVGAGVLELLTRLVDKSLVHPAVRPRGARYRLLESVREYALERLADNGEPDAVRRRHAQHYLGVAEQAAAHLDKADAADWLDLLTIENGNLRSALDWSSSAEPELYVRMTLALGSFWSARGFQKDAAIRLQRALEYESGRTAARRRLLGLLGGLTWESGDFPAARRHLEESVAVAREIGDQAILGAALGNLGFVLFGGGDYSDAGGLFAEQLRIATRLQDDALLANALSNSAIHALHELDGPGAVAAAERSLDISRRLGDSWSVGIVLGLKGVALILTGDLRGAQTDLEEAIRIRAAIGSGRHVGVVLDFFAELAATLGKPERALLLAGAADAVYASAAISAPSLAMASRRRWIGRVRTRVGKRAEILLREGAAFDHQEAVAFALDAQAAASPSHRGALPEGLSDREREVAQLVAGGLTNREVAARLGLAVRTIDSHLEHVRSKLGVTSRSEIAQWIAGHAAAEL